MSDIPCVNLFARLAAEDPSRLITMLGDGSLSNADLTFAAEEAGRCGDAACAALLALLGHESAVVREGAIYGLQRLEPSPTITDTLTRIAASDPSPGVRSAAAEVYP